MIDRMLALVGLLLAIGAIVAQYRFPKIPKFVTDFLVLGGGVLVGIMIAPVVWSLSTTETVSAPVYAFPTSSAVMLSWGSNQGVVVVPGSPPTLEGNVGSHIEVDGSKVSHIDATKYKIIGISFHHFTGDVLDAGNINKSGLYDIILQRFLISVPWCEQYGKEVANGVQGTAYVVLALPLGLETDQFETLRQAIALGAVVLASGAGPP